VAELVAEHERLRGHHARARGDDLRHLPVQQAQRGSRHRQQRGPSQRAAERAGEVTGFFIGREAANEAEVLNLAVMPKFRRQGDGRALLSAALEEIRSRGVQSVFLEVRESNLGAIAFYESFGFSKIGRRKIYYQDPEEAAINMEKKLTGPPG